MAAHHPTELARRVLRTPGLGHEQRFLPPTLDARCRFSHETFTGTRGNGRDAPIGAVRRTSRTEGSRKKRSFARR